MTIRLHYGRATASLALAIFAALCLAAHAEDKLSKRVEEHLAQPHFKTAHWGFLFVDLKTGEAIYASDSRDEVAAVAARMHA